jgi:general secretion pathway protein M
MMNIDQLSQRERRMLAGGAVLLGALLMLRFGWMPIEAERADLNSDIARYLTLESLAQRADTRPAVQTATPAQSAPVPQRITQSAEAAGIPLTRLEAEGDRLRISVQSAAFADLITWIADMETTRALRLVAVELDRLAEPGTVSARLTVEPAR